MAFTCGSASSLHEDLRTVILLLGSSGFSAQSERELQGLWGPSWAPLLSHLEAGPVFISLEDDFCVFSLILFVHDLGLSLSWPKKGWEALTSWAVS